MHEPVEITVEVKRETSFAVLANDGDVEAWVPKSQISRREKIKRGVEEITVPLWLAIQKGFV